MIIGPLSVGVAPAPKPCPARCRHEGTDVALQGLRIGVGLSMRKAGRVRVASNDFGAPATPVVHAFQQPVSA
jgi:hypothetical protein